MKHFLQLRRPLTLRKYPVGLPTVLASCVLAEPGCSICLQFPALALVGWCTMGLLWEACTVTGAFPPHWPAVRVHCFGI